MVDIIERIEKVTKGGTIIPKPAAKDNFRIKGWGSRRGERALVYTIPNHKDPNRPYQKGVTITEWLQAYHQLVTNGDFRRSWFDQFMPDCAKEGGCNYTTIGGVFELLGDAEYSGPGLYRRVGHANS